MLTQPVNRTSLRSSDTSKAYEKLGNNESVIMDDLLILICLVFFLFLCCCVAASSLITNQSWRYWSVY